MTTYRIVLPRGRKPLPLAIAGEKVIGFVEGYATALGQEDRLNAISPTAAEETRRIHALQIGESLGWWRYLYPEYDDTEGTP